MRQRKPVGENLYQLWNRTELPVGSPFQIDGPYDKTGKVVSVIRYEEGKGYLHLVRGDG